jgi:nucleoside-diphosphate-sugar epimerase
MTTQHEMEKETSMAPTSKESASHREILLVGPYGVLGTGVIDAVAANPAWRVITAARRAAPTYRTQTPPRHISVDLMDREGTIKDFSSLDTVTDLVYAAYVEKATMAETVAPNARMLANTLEALAARNVPLKRIVLAGGAKSYGFSLGSFNAPAKETEPRLIAPIHYHQQEDIVADWSTKNGASWTVLRPHLVMGPSLNSPMNLGDKPRCVRGDQPRARASVAVSRPPRRVEHTSGHHRRRAIWACHPMGARRG